jgi:hypothetical protein
MRALLIAAALAGLSACASAPPRGANVSDARDCAVMTAMLQQHYKIDASSPYRLDRGDGPTAPGDEPYRITCDFAAAGVAIQTYDHSRPGAPPPNFQSWIKFLKPAYPDASTAIIESGSLLGPLAGSGKRCTLRRENDAWRVGACTMTWIS